MRVRTGIAALLAALIVASAAVAPSVAQGPHQRLGGTDVIGRGGRFRPPRFLRQLVSPRLVMEHQAEIGLRPEQVDAIKRAMTEAQQRLLELQWQLDGGSEALAKLVADDHVDEAKALAKLDEVTAIEREVKKTNFTLLVRVKNALDPEQQAKVRAYKPFGIGEPPDASPAPGD
jgi:Spy/CpxP family protein refolding chaperone